MSPARADLALPPAARSLRFAGLPIDQVFAKGDVVVISATTLEAVGSDHLPVLVEFSLLGGTEPDAGCRDGDASVASEA